MQGENVKGMITLYNPSLSTLFSVFKELKWRPDTKSLRPSSLLGTGMGKKGGKFFKRM
jgi:F-box/leucine-rich repeat protein 2/20